MAERRRRISRAERIGLRAGMADRLLPFMVAAMSFLASLALAGSIAAAALATHWLGSAQRVVTVEVPDPGKPARGDTAPRAAAVLAALAATPGITEARELGRREITRLLKPWLGSDPAGQSLPITLPAVELAQSTDDPESADRLAAALNRIAPGTLVDSGARWARQLAVLTESLRASAAATLLIVGLVAASVVAVAVRSGLAQRRDAIEIIHGLGALDADIAGAFARRAMRLAGLGGAMGALIALPVLIWLAHLSAAFVTSIPAANVLDSLPPALWAAPVILTLATSLIGWAAAQVTVRGWLKRLV